MSSDHSKAVEARGLLYQVKSFSFIISLISFDRILSTTKQLSDQLQSSIVDLYRASELVLATKIMLQHFRTYEYWKQVYQYAADVAKLHSIPEVCDDDPVKQRRRKRPARLEDSIITESVGSRELITTSEHFKTRLYFPVVDQFIVEMSKRFDHSNDIVLKGVAACSPSSSVFLSFEEMKPFCLLYEIDVDTLKIEVDLLSQAFPSVSGVKTIVELASYIHSCLPAYSNFHQVVQIALTIAVTNAECERSFSSLKK